MDPLHPTWLPFHFFAGLIAWGSVATDFVLASSILFSRRHLPVGIARVLLAVMALGVWIGLKCFVLLALGKFFLCVQFVYLDTFVLLPTMGLVLLLRRRVELTKPVRFACFASFALIPIVIYATFIEPYQLVTERTTVALAPERAGVDPIVIGVLADIQCVVVTDRERAALSRIMSAKPDLILIPGDLVQVGSQRLPEILDEFHALLAPLDAPLGVYFVQGNCESKDDARRLIEGTRVRMLDNEIVELSRGDRRITLCGVDLNFASAQARDVLQRIESAPGRDDVRIVFAHRPDVIYSLPPSSRVDLVVAGHTHGGQVQIPFFGPPIILSGVPRHIGAGGLHELDGRRIYVSRGLGWEHGDAPRVRFFSLPEVSLLTLTAEGSATTPL